MTSRRSHYDGRIHATWRQTLHHWHASMRRPCTDADVVSPPPTAPRMMLVGPIEQTLPLRLLRMILEEFLQRDRRGSRDGGNIGHLDRGGLPTLQDPCISTGTCLDLMAFRMQDAVRTYHMPPYATGLGRHRRPPPILTSAVPCSAPDAGLSANRRRSRCAEGNQARGHPERDREDHVRSPPARWRPPHTNRAGP